MGEYIENLVPDQRVGSQMDAVESKITDTLFQAQELFSLAAERLLDVNCWGKISGMSEFRLCDPNGNQVDRPAQKGDFIRIDIPGPGTLAGNGFDWVRVEEIKVRDDKNSNLVAMRVRPSRNPTSKHKEVAHFLKDDATSTFLICRDRIWVWAEEHGRNEIPNIYSGRLIDRGRNLVIGFAAKLGISYPQWKLLVKGLLNTEG